MRFQPMLVTSGPLRPDSDRYAFEVKWDGFRALIEASPRGVKVWSRNGNEMTARYPELQALAGAVRSDVVLDGEIVALDEDGKPDFAALWFRSRGAVTPPVCFMAFDLLQIGDDSLIDRPYSERRRILESLGLDGPNWCTPEIHVGEGAALFAATKEMGLEGVVAKRLASTYRPGARTRSWIKTKHMRTERFALLGWLPPDQRRHGERGGVVAAFTAGDALAYAGLVESGVTEEVVRALPELSRSDFEQARAGAAMASAATADIRFLEWSPAGGLRHASLVTVSDVSS